jgi:hypothetical protein
VLRGAGGKCAECPEEESKSMEAVGASASSASDPEIREAVETARRES